MKMIVTGGNRGLGKAMVDQFNAFSFDTLSVSRETGYDIAIAKSIKGIVDLSLKYDIFVNNAFDGPPQEEWANFGQTKLLLALYDAWKREGKTGWIFNIGSIASESIVTPEPRFETYRVSKAALDHASLQCSRAFKENTVKFRTVLIKPDRLDTPLSRSRENWTGNGINCRDICEFMSWCLELDPNVNIDQITISCNLDCKE